MTHTDRTILLIRLNRAVGLGAIALLLVFGLAAGVMAQDNSLLAALTGVDSQNFPQVSIFLTAWQGSRPVEGLTGASFEVLEGEGHTPAQVQNVKSVSLKGLRLVLAFDVSMSEADLRNVTAAATTTLVNNFGPEDRAAVLAFSNQVSLKRDFTNNTSELASVMAGLAREGDRTALNGAIAEAATMLDRLPSGRKAIIVFTDSFDNIGTPTLDRVLIQVLKARLPVFIFGLGQKIQNRNHPFNYELPRAGGEFFILPAGGGEVEPRLAELEKRLRQGYQITFLSALKADNTEQDVIVRVSGPGDPAPVEAAGQFITTPSPVNLAVRGLAANDTVTGEVELGVDTTSQARLVAVTYRLDDQILAEVTTPPYTFTWNTATASPGPHLLIVEAVDEVGNKGETRLNFSVAAPLTVEISSPQREIEIGQPATIGVKINAPGGLVQVDFLLNGRLLESRTGPPYNFNFDSRQYAPGPYRVTIQVTDELGQTAEDSLELQLLPAPPPPPGWFERFIRDSRVRFGFVVITALAALLALIGLTILVIRLISQAQARRAWRYGRLEMANAGNIRTRYGLLATTAENRLLFQFKHNGALLPLLSPPQPPQAATAAPVRPASPGRLPSGRPAAPERQPNQTFAQAQGLHTQASGGLSVFTGILDTAGQLLPGAASSQVGQVSQQIRGKQAAVDRTVNTGTQQVRTADYLRGQVSQAVPAGRGGAPEPYPSALPGGEGGPAEGAGPIGLVGGPGWQAQPASRQPSGREGPAADGWVITPPVEPGQSLNIDLLVIPSQPYRKQTVPITLLTRPLDEPGTPAQQEPGLVEIKGLFWLWRFLPRLGVILLMLFLAWQVISLAVWRLTLMNLV